MKEGQDMGVDSRLCWERGGYGTTCDGLRPAF